MKKVNVFEKLADLIIEVKKNKGVKRLSLVSAGLLTIMALSIPAVQAGCTYTVDEYGNVTVIPDDPEQTPEQTPDNPEQTPDNQEPTTEIIETTEPEVVKEEPQFILYNEDGSIYEPQQVTLDDVKDKIAEAEEKYNFLTDWNRDRYVAMLLKYNCYYMNEEDVITVYDDYLSNFGWNAISNEYAGLSQKVFAGDKKEPYSFGAYFVDPKLSHDVDLMDEYCKENGRAALLDLMSEKVENVDYTNKGVYNTFTYDLWHIFGDEHRESDYKNETLKNFFTNCPDENLESDVLFSTYISNAGRCNDEKYNIFDYVSSHDNELEKTK